MMTNEEIIENLAIAGALMEINDENTFKSGAYKSASYNLEKLGHDFMNIPDDDIPKLDGVGKSIGQAIIQMKASGTFDELERLKSAIPEGVIGMLSLNGVGPKKIRVLWKDLNINSKPDLLKACKEGRIATQKGFGEKTQKAIEESLRFEMSQSGRLRLDQAMEISKSLQNELLKYFKLVEESGKVYSKDEIVDIIAFVIGCDEIIKAHHIIDGITILEKDLNRSSPFIWRGRLANYGVDVEIILEHNERVCASRYLHSASDVHLSELVLPNVTLLKYLKTHNFQTEAEIFDSINLPFIGPENREGIGEWEMIKNQTFPKLIEFNDLKGPLHNHSVWSDGKNSLEQMVQFCKGQGWEYLGISDHSQSATYANGLQPERVISQHKEIDKLNKEFPDFRIFKGIESDILADGSLDYGNDIMQLFDYVVASVHTGLSMDVDKATDRLIKAVENPFTTILGHPTGRLLLKRKGYPLNFAKIIDACASNGVAIEINANPWRLDLSWHYVKLALDKGVKIAICPDAHENAGFLDMQFGIWMGKKGFLTAEMCVNCMNTSELTRFFQTKNTKI